jgi:2-hydroxy-3-keto-5-methylthiopentenyl-1-phosphate phosphatase
MVWIGSVVMKERKTEAGRMGTLITDFDGTLTRHDFFRLAVERLLPAGVPDYWQEYLAGRLTHFQAMQAYYAAIRHLLEHLGVDLEGYANLGFLM